MKLLAYACMLLIGSLAGPQPLGAQPAQEASTQDVRVEVVEIAGGQAYLAPGESAGVRAGTSVLFGKRRFIVLTASASNAVVELDNRGLKRGAIGVARVKPVQDAQALRRAPPRSLAAFRGQWPRVRKPSESQSAKPVPLGPITSHARAAATLSLASAANLPLSGSAEPIGRAELRGRLRYEPFVDLPARFDADVAAQLWLADSLSERAGGTRSRPVPRVRELQASYGSARDFYAALGRLRYASRVLGMLDGAKVQAPLWTGVTLGAFGGFVPDPLDGMPASDVSRFGAELGYENLESSLRPRAALSAHGSRWEGELDERRLSAFADIFPGESHLGGYAELALFDGDNPWNAPTAQLAAAGAEGSVRFGEVELGTRFDAQRPERSLWLASLLPAEWLCVPRPDQVSAMDETCYGDEVRYLGSADVSYRAERFLVSAGGTASTSTRTQTDQMGGFVAASVLRVVGPVRIDTSFMASTGSLIRTLAGSIGFGALLLDDTFDASLRYRPALTRYDADTGPFVEHSVGASFELAATRSLTLSLDADAITGRDLDALLLSSLATWRL